MPLPKLPRKDPDYPQSEHELLASTKWAAIPEIIPEFEMMLTSERNDHILLGQLTKKNGEIHYVGVTDDRHVITVAGSRGGKGTSLIVPNLLSYKHNVVVVFPP